MNNMRNKILMTLALLLMAVTGAWAAEETLLTTITGAGSNTDPATSANVSYSTEGVATLTFSEPTSDGHVKYQASPAWGWWGNAITLTVTPAEGYTITKCVFYDDQIYTATDSEAPFVVETTKLDKTPKVNGTPIKAAQSKGVTKIEVYGYAPVTGPEVTPVAGKTNEWTFVMPAYDVEIAPIYAPTAQWAKVENVDQLPTAVEGIFAGTEDAIVKAGTVVEGQGTVMYFATTDAEMTAEKAAAAEGWLATVPTAEGYDGAQTVYVWYFIKGADTPQGEKATAENTFNDSEICATPLTVTVLSNKFDIQFNAANANTIEAGKATVTVSGAAATVTEGKLEGVKMGSEVKIKTKEGYKFRKAEGKKKTSIVPVTAITLNKTETSIKVGATETLSVTSVLPEEATDKTYTWKTSDETKATVDQDGKVTAVAEGTVTIYAEANDGSGVKGNCTVTVTPAPVPVTVTWNNNDITGTGNSFTKGGVTLTAGQIDYKDKDISLDGTFTTTLGNFTKIEVTTAWFSASGTGWSSGTGITPKTGTWTGNASSVSFSGNIWGQGEGNTKFVFTIEPKN